MARVFALSSPVKRGLSAACLAASATVLAPVWAWAEEQPAIGPATVIDGDSLKVGGRRFRLWGIDAPEPGQRCRRGGRWLPCGRLAATALMDLTAGASTRCEPQQGRSADRQSDETVARCEVGGFDLSRNMVHTGWALADPAVSGQFDRIEASARDAGRGLWDMAFIAPWRWRAGVRLAGENDGR